MPVVSAWPDRSQMLTEPGMTTRYSIAQTISGMATMSIRRVCQAMWRGGRSIVPWCVQGWIRRFSPCQLCVVGMASR